MLYVHIPPPLKGTQSNLPTHFHAQKGNVLKIEKLNNELFLNIINQEKILQPLITHQKAHIEACRFGEMLAQMMFLNLLNTLFSYYTGPSPASHPGGVGLYLL